MPTQGQIDRQNTRDQSTGRYSEGLECEGCGKRAPFNYASHPDCNSTGELLVLCGRPRCPGTYATEHFPKIADAVTYVMAQREKRGR